jgi:hypothetical protein
VIFKETLGVDLIYVFVADVYMHDGGFGYDSRQRQNDTCPHAQGSSSTPAARLLPRMAAALQHGALVPSWPQQSAALVPSEPPPHGSDSLVVGRSLTRPHYPRLDLRVGHLWRRFGVCGSLLHRGPCFAPPFSVGSSRRLMPLTCHRVLPDSARTHRRCPLPLPPFPRRPPRAILSITPTAAPPGGRG